LFEKKRISRKSRKKNFQSESKKLRSEINQLKSNPQITSKQQKELETKRKRLNELEKKKIINISPNNSGSNLVVYLSLGGVALLITGVLLLQLVRRKKRSKSFF